ncbi:MAG: hypothetical protein LBR23_04780 [Spirochaetaceae bacterium]|nr:hypothetical protein [Spirochaetaceae bacterium]
MRTLNVAISDVEYAKFGIKRTEFAFSDLLDLVGQEIRRQNLDDCVSLAEKYGLSAMTMDDIQREVTAVRQYAQ